MSAAAGGVPVLNLPDGLVVGGEGAGWRLPRLALAPGEWVAFSPTEGGSGADAAPALGRVLATVAAPLAGSVAILGRDPARLPYLELQRLRAALGYVQSAGGLLSNRSVRENLALPVEVHAGLDEVGVAGVVDAAIARFDLAAVAGRRPYELDAALQWRVRVARALVLQPSFLVLEGAGSFGLDRGRGVGWARLLEVRAAGRTAAAVCLGWPDAEFEAWFEGVGGRVVRLAAETPAGAGSGERSGA